MSIHETDAASRAVAKNDNRISLDYIESQVAVKFYTTGQACADAAGITTSGDARDAIKDWPSLNSMTICLLVMRNGFVVIGKSAPLDPANFNAELGQKFAYEDAVRQCWPLYAFANLEVGLRYSSDAIAAKAFNAVSLASSTNVLQRDR